MSYLADCAYASALTAIAAGATRDETRSDLLDSYPSLSADEISKTLDEALDGARSCGVEREDIDESWF